MYRPKPEIHYRTAAEFAATPTLLIPPEHYRDYAARTGEKPAVRSNTATAPVDENMDGSFISDPSVESSAALPKATGGAGVRAERRDETMGRRQRALAIDEGSAEATRAALMRSLSAATDETTEVTSIFGATIDAFCTADATTASRDDASTPRPSTPTFAAAAAATSCTATATIEAVPTKSAARASPADIAARSRRNKLPEKYLTVEAKPLAKSAVSAARDKALKLSVNLTLTAHSLMVERHKPTTPPLTMELLEEAAIKALDAAKALQAIEIETRAMGIILNNTTSLLFKRSIANAGAVTAQIFSHLAFMRSKINNATDEEATAEMNKTWLHYGGPGHYERACSAQKELTHLRATQNQKKIAERKHELASLKKSGSPHPGLFRVFNSWEATKAGAPPKAPVSKKAETLSTPTPSA